jgi:catechol 2,3-dioxygenase-like lactoylglutathione lyase family enzyme
MTPRKGLPGLRGADHIGLTVPDMQQAIEFFVGKIGAEPYYGLGPFHDDDTDSFEVQFGVPSRAVLNEIRLLRLGNLNIELFEWDAPGHDEVPALNENGGHELCLYVDDIDAAISYLQGRGVEVLGEKMELVGPEAGDEAWFVYFRAPWGLLLELISYPHGRAYEAEYPRPLWNPSRPDPVIRTQSGA